MDIYLIVGLFNGDGWTYRENIKAFKYKNDAEKYLDKFNMLLPKIKEHSYKCIHNSCFSWSGIFNTQELIKIEIETIKLY